jgi:hypothetical protein
MFKPTWATNVFGVKIIWTKLSRPTLSKSTTEVGWVVQRTKENAANDASTRYNQIPSRHHRFKFFNMLLGRVKLNDGFPFF